MPEPPDFDQLARQVISGSEHHIARVAEQLRQVWNARGAADRETIEAALLEDGDDSQMNNINRALNGLDR